MPVHPPESIFSLLFFLVVAVCLELCQLLRLEVESRVLHKTSSVTYLVVVCIFSCFVFFPTVNGILSEILVSDHSVAQNGRGNVKVVWGPELGSSLGRTKLVVSLISVCCVSKMVLQNGILWGKWPILKMVYLYITSVFRVWWFDVVCYESTVESFYIRIGT